MSLGIDEVYTCLVRYLRMLTNSLLAGALAAAYLTILLLQLNPQVPLASATSARWFATFGLFYGVHLAILFYLLIVGREFFSMNVMSPGWLSVRVLAWLTAACAACAAVLMWLNLRGFSAALEVTAARRMATGAAATSVAAAVLLGIAIAHYSFGRRGSRVGAALFAIAVIGSIALPVAARGPAVLHSLPSRSVNIAVLPASPSQARVVMLLLDGASLEYIWPRASEGRLPNFARLLESGATIDLATIRPTAPNPVWSAVATGIYPSRNGVRSAAAYFARGDDRALDLLPDHCFSHVPVQLGFIRDEPNTSTAWRARPLWSILADAGVRVGVVRWPLTYPAEPVQGFVVSDRFHDVVGSMLELDNRAAFPSAVLPTLREAFAQSGPDQDAVVAATGAAVNPTSADASAARRDRFYSRAMRDLRARWDVQFAALRYQGLDTFGHYFLRYTQPRAFGDVPEQERRRYADAIDRYYSHIDGEVGDAMKTLSPGDLLLVVSGFGMQRLEPLKQLLGRVLGEEVTATHDRAPDGFLLAYGSDVQPGHHQRGSIVDVTPTLLYFFGLPIGRDMDGFARTDLFTRGFTAERPIAFIPSYGR
jgi:predicted AlkP superfamily phosphohydrolase/phosphomutase